MFGNDRRHEIFKDVLKVAFLLIFIFGLVAFEAAVLNVEYTTQLRKLLAVGFGFMAYLYSATSVVSALLLILVRDDGEECQPLLLLIMVAFLIAFAVAIQLIFWAVILKNGGMAILAGLIALIIGVALMIRMATR